MNVFGQSCEIFILNDTFYFEVYKQNKCIFSEKTSGQYYYADGIGLIKVESYRKNVLVGSNDLVKILPLDEFLKAMEE